VLQKQKNTLARQLDLRPRQVEVWFQNRRARTKLKQTEVDCERLKRCCDCLALENRRLQKELHELKAIKSVASISSAPAAGRGGGTHMSQQLDYSSYSRPLLPAAATLTMCASCERVSTVADNRAAHTSNNFTKPAPAPAFSPHLVQSSTACS
jgi:homeobox-leucine zipper protein